MTYGLERIAMFLQRVDNVFDLEWAPGVRYGEVRHARGSGAVEVRVRPGHRHRPARCYSSYHRHQFDEAYAFGERCWPRGLLLPALEHCLKCSHLFNLLDSSGSVGVTERTAYILRVRQLSVAICKRYAEECVVAEASAEAR